MRVILDVNKPSCISFGVQRCSSVESFLEIEKMHPEDEFVIDPASIEAFLEYQEKLALDNVRNFCDELGVSYEDFSAMLDYYGNPAILAEAYEIEEEDYYSDYDAEMLREAIWITKHC